MAQVKALFYIPLRDNDGRSLATEILDLQAELYLRFVGWTFLGYVKGAFRMADGTQALDESGAYVVVLEEARIPELEEVLRDFKSKSLQESITLKSNAISRFDSFEMESLTMTKREQVEQQIREILATECHAIPLSNKLFRPDGLFNELAKTEEERRILTQSPLFREAQNRFMELQQKEAREFAQAVNQTQAAIPEGSYLLKLESADKA